MRLMLKCQMCGQCWEADDGDPIPEHDSPQFAELGSGILCTGPEFVGHKHDIHPLGECFVVWDKTNRPADS